MWQMIKRFFAFLSNHFKALLLIIIVFALFAPDSCSSPTARPNLAKVKLQGEILQSEAILKQFAEIEKDPFIRGVLFEVDSPGGTVPPSIEIAYAIKALRQSKPVVAYASGTLASGSYYASIYANTIVANPGAMIGSIGVILQGINAQELMKSIGVAPQVAKVGEYKEVGTFTREWNPEEKEALQKLLDDTYQLFVGDVAEARGLNVNESERFANARIFLAKEAKTLGLIDEVGTQRDAIAKLKALTGVQNVIWKEQDPFEKMMERFNEQGVKFFHTLFATKVKAISSVE
jgi:protease-4